MNALSYSWQKEGNVHFIADEEPAESISMAAVDDVVSRTEELLRGGSMDDLQAFLSCLLRPDRQRRAVPCCRGLPDLPDDLRHTPGLLRGSRRTGGGNTFWSTWTSRNTGKWDR